MVVVTGRPVAWVGWWHEGSRRGARRCGSWCVIHIALPRSKARKCRQRSTATLKPSPKASATVIAELADEMPLASSAADF
jgi:hypothetical protein